MKITVLGDGAWGTAVACLFAEKGYSVTLWCHNHDVAHAIQSTGYNSHYFPHASCAGVTVTTSLTDAVRGAVWLFEAIPVVYLRSVLERACSLYTPEQIWVVLSKGIEKDTYLLPTSIINDVFNSQVTTVVASGPSYAYDLAHKKPTGIVVAASEYVLAQSCAQLLATEYLTTELSSDPVGVQLCGALKNGIALGVGILDGAGYTDNTKALLITRGLHEMERILIALGGDSDTVYGLAGVGDLILTAMGSLSKNRLLGRELGSGQLLADLIKSKNGVMPEGINTLQSVDQLIRKHQLELPVYHAIHDIAMNGAPVANLIAAITAQ